MRPTGRRGGRSPDQFHLPFGDLAAEPGETGTARDRTRAAARVVTIPPGVGFLETLSDALLDGRLVPGFVPARDPLALSRATILVPTRRAARALATTLAARIAAPAVLLPRILPLGGLDAIETDLAFDATTLEDPLADDPPGAIAPVARRMILTRLVLQWAQAVQRAIVAVGPDGERQLHPHEELLVAASAADAWTLAGDLAALSDEFIAEGIDWTRIAPLGTDAYDRYWRITLDFLAIVVERWPALLAERGEVDAVTRQMALVTAEIARLERGGATGPVIVAGSTGSNTATARLIEAIARLPQGAVVLPGLDGDLEARGWAEISGPGGDAATHPQAALKRLLGTMGVERGDVVPLGRAPGWLAARARFVSEALRPAETTDLWRGFAGRGAPLVEALEGLALIEATDEREEALAIAIALREALEQPGTAVLVTPDRTLGRRVREDLTRWGIDIDESGGEPLGTTPAGALARLVLDSAVQELAPVEVLALLAHPLARFGRARSVVVELAGTLEVAILRGVLPPRGLHDLDGLLARARAARTDARAPDPLRRLTEADFDRLVAFTRDVIAALMPLARLPRDTPLPDWLFAHQAVLDAVTATSEDDSSLSGLDGNALSTLFEALDDAREPAIALDAAGYAALFDRFAAGTPVRGPNRSHPRLKILGLLEARLLSADLMILGGLDEGVWPPQSRTDVFLNRPMRADLGLPPPERRIGQTAHDLTMLMGAPRVLITRAAKRGGSPAVPSRFVLRMAALAGEAWDAVRGRGARYRALADALDHPIAAYPIQRPAPRPPLALRPTTLSVTRVETLRRDPYAIYAERILKLRPADPIRASMGPREYGTLFHDAMATFSRAYASGPLPAGAAERLQQEVAARFADAWDDATFQAFVWPRISGWARGFLSWDGGRRAGAVAPLIEAKGRLELPLADGSVFTLTAQADRIEIGAGHRLRLVDYKTGRPPSLKEVKAGFAPQLTLEAAMAERGAFATLPPGAEVEGATYVKFAKGGVVETVELTWKDAAFADVVADHLAGLVTLLDTFRDEATGYMARPFPQFAARFGDYDHLSRVKEWSSGTLEGDDA